jgi:hypothetical protein
MSIDAHELYTPRFPASVAFSGTMTERYVWEEQEEV